MSKFTCSICGKGFNNVFDYASHVSKCAEDYKKKEEADLQKMNDDLNRVKAAKSYYEDQLAKFKENYPEAYELNFGKEKTCKCHNNTKSCDNKYSMQFNKNEANHVLEADPFVHNILKLLQS